MADAKRKGMLRSRMLLIVTGLILVVGTVAGAVWLINQWAQPDMVEMMRLNNKGIGIMEQYDHKNAVPVFEEIVKEAPAWAPGKINLGIALLNRRGPADDKKGIKCDLDRALDIFAHIIKNDPKNLYAHFCTGIIHSFRGELIKARPHFDAVVAEDPHDPHAWEFLARTYPIETKKARDCFQKAVELNPYLSGALYGLKDAMRFVDEKKSKELADRFFKLKKAELINESKIIFSFMGKYAEPIGRDDSMARPVQPASIPLFDDGNSFKIVLSPGTKWAVAADIGSGVAADLFRGVRNRFGGVSVVLDFDQDGKLDLFLLGAVVQNGKVRDLLLHNEGKGVFRDVTESAGLAESRISLGCSAGDFNNDTFPDLIITSAGRQHLFCNRKSEGDLRWFKLETDQIKCDSVCLGSMWIDLDQDSDLDLLLCQVAETSEKALGVVKDGAPSENGLGLAVFLNVGKALPAGKDEPIPLTTSFRKFDGSPTLCGQGGRPINLAASDLDRDIDVDIIQFGAAMRPELVLNDRLLKFDRVQLPAKSVATGTWNGAVVFDFNKDVRSDLFLVNPKQASKLLINQPNGAARNIGKWFSRGVADSPPMLHAQAVDLDLDGWMDIVGISKDGKPVYLRNDGKRLAQVRNAFGLDETVRKDLVAVGMFDADKDHIPDLMLWSEKQGLILKRSLGNGHHGIALRLLGLVLKREIDTRCNADGFGAWVVIQSGGHWTGGELTTRSGGLGQSNHSILFGLGRQNSAEVIRMRWPDNILQAEMSLPAEQIHVIRQESRYHDSCPLLFAWDGERFVFVTDILGAGAMGEGLPGGAHRRPRPTESIKIGSDRLKPKDGMLQVKIIEARDEVAYLDRMQLLAVDQPDNLESYPDERFITSPSGPSQDILVYPKNERVFPNSATDHANRDVAQSLRHWDRQMVTRFRTLVWKGYAEDHWIDLDFGDQLAKYNAKDPLILCLAGWTAYPYPEAMWAADQAKVALQPPILQRKNADGEWQTILPELGFPAGFPRMMTVDVTGKLTGPSCVLRIRTNMQVFWDQVFVVPLLERVSAAQNYPSPKRIRVHPLRVQNAELIFRGFVQEYSPDGQQPTMYDYNRLESVAVPRFTGRFTRFGKVTELLHERDDQFVIMGPGEEVSMAFDARSLPPLPKGWTRSFVLKAHGYSKSCGPFIATGGTTFPLPFHGMSNFPYRPDEHYPNTPAHREYLRRYLTRHVGSMRP